MTSTTPMPRTRIQWTWPTGWMVVRWRQGEDQIVARYATTRPSDPDCQPVLCPELGSLQRYTALQEHAREVAEDEHIAGSDYSHRAPMVCGWRRVRLVSSGEATIRIREEIDRLVARAITQRGRIVMRFDEH